jgi:Fic family protein
MAAKASAKSSKKESVSAPSVVERVAGVKGSSKRKLAVAAAVDPPPKQLTLEERWTSLTERLAKAEPEFQRAYQESLDMSWIYHDSALEGSVYTPIELRSAVDASGVAGGGVPMVTDSSIQPICEEIRRHREALDFIRDYATKKRMPITLDVVKKIYLILHPEEGDIKTVKYRKDIPQHRLYFHEYAPPDKITYKVRQILDWTNDPETRRTRSAVRIAARAHYDLLRVFPFTTDSGKVARLFMNLLLLRNGFPPAIVHSTERQRYYEALKGASAVMTQIVHESIENNLASVEKLLEAHESKGYAVKV